MELSRDESWEERLRAGLGEPSQPDFEAWRARNADALAAPIPSKPSRTLAFKRIFMTSTRLIGQTQSRDRDVTAMVVAASNETREELAMRSRPAARSEWRWVALICTVVVVLGAVRYWREWQFQSLISKSEASPFPLQQFPKDLGSWRFVPGTEETLEPEIALIAGANDHVIRTYVDEKTGERVVVMILYGRADRLFSHVPEVCYPANGFAQSPEKQDLDIPVDGTTAKARFRMERFVKRYPTGTIDFREVYHSFLHNGEWGLDMLKNWKRFRYHPGMYKVQVQRQVSRSDIDSENESLDWFLGLIVREIEERAAQTPRATDLSNGGRNAA